MPNREQRRSGELEKMGFNVTLRTTRGVEPYDIDISNLSAQDELDFHQTTGFTFFEAFEHMSAYVVAAFVWLERRKYEKRLGFAEVAKEVKVRDLESLKVFGEDDDEQVEVSEPAVNGKNPERSGESSAKTSLDSPLSTG